MSNKQFRQVHPSFPDGSVMMDMSGWCTACAVYLERENEDAGIFDPGTDHHHTHSVPWRLGPQPRRKEERS